MSTSKPTGEPCLPTCCAEGEEVLQEVKVEEEDKQGEGTNDGETEHVLPTQGLGTWRRSQQPHVTAM